MYIILLGAPGSGKGTQGALLADHLGIPKISTGDLLRTAVKEETPLGHRAETYMAKGLLVPDEIVLGLIEDVLESAEAANGVIMDGFPRTRAQAEAVDRMLEARSAAIDYVLLLEVADRELVRRLLGRARREGRSDDTRRTIEQRLKVFRDQTEPLVARYRERGLVRVIEGVGSIRDIAQRVRQAVEA